MIYLYIPSRGFDKVGVAPKYSAMQTVYKIKTVNFYSKTALDIVISTSSSFYQIPKDIPMVRICFYIN